MSAPMEWELRLHNEVSAAAKAAGLDMRAFQAEVVKAQESLYLLTLSQRRESSAARETKEAHEGLFADVFKAEALKDGVEELARSVEELGMELVKSTLEAADFDYKASVGLTHLTGSAEQAEDIIAHARAFANGTGEDLDKVVSTFQHLAATGLRGDQLTAATAAAQDLAAVTGRSFDQTSQLFEMIGSDRGLGGRAVRQLAQFPGLLNELERHFGFVPGTAKSFEQLTKHLTEAPIKGAAGLALLEDEVLRVAHEGALGDVGTEMGLSFEGGLQKIKNDFKEIFGDLSTDPAFADLRRSLSAVAEYFDPATESGKQFEKEVASAIKPVLDDLHEILAHPKALRDFFGDAVDTAKVLATIVETLAWPLEQIAHLAVSTHKLFAQTEANHESALEAGRAHQEVDLARQLIALGVPPAEAAEAVKGVAVPAKADEAVKGVAVPAKADGGTVQSTGLVTVHEGEEIVPASVTSGGGGGGGGGGHTFHFHVSVDSGGHPVDEQAIAAKMEEMLPGALISALEQMNQQRGG